MNLRNNTMIKVFYFVMTLIIMGCGQSFVETIDADQLKKLQAEGVKVVDIRTPGEFEEGHLSGVIHIDFLNPDFSKRMNELDKEQPVVVYCASGGRSTKAASMLSEQGFQKVYNYKGGFSDWKRRGEEIEK